MVNQTNTYQRGHVEIVRQEGSGENGRMVAANDDLITTMHVARCTTGMDWSTVHEQK